MMAATKKPIGKSKAEAGQPEPVPLLLPHAERLAAGKATIDGVQGDKLNNVGMGLTFPDSDS
jgi:hypothetical protein